MVEVVSRETVGLVPARSNSAKFVNVSSITGHYFGGDMRVNSEADLFRIYRQIQYQDMITKGYSDIMYSIGTNPFRPQVIILRGLGVRGAANGSSFSNMVSPSVLIPIGPNLTGVSHIPHWLDNLIESCRMADDVIEWEFGRGLPWVPHKAWRPTACPGDMFSGLIAEAFDERPPPPVFPVWYPDPDLTNRPMVGFGHLERDTGDDGYVWWVQRFLNQTAPEGCPVDGIWGPISHDRLCKFQGYFYQAGNHGLPHPPNGLTDLDTWAMIHLVATVEGIV